jgi:hypothetical protein
MPSVYDTTSPDDHAPLTVPYVPWGVVTVVDVDVRVRPLPRNDWPVCEVTWNVHGAVAQLGHLILSTKSPSGSVAPPAVSIRCDTEPLPKGNSVVVVRLTETVPTSTTIDDAAYRFTNNATLPLLGDDAVAVVDEDDEDDDDDDEGPRTPSRPRPESSWLLAREPWWSLRTLSERRLLLLLLLLLTVSALLLSLWTEYTCSGRLPRRRDPWPAQHVAPRVSALALTPCMTAKYRIPALLVPLAVVPWCEINKEKEWNSVRVTKASEEDERGREWASSVAWREHAKRAGEERAVSATNSWPKAHLSSDCNVVDGALNLSCVFFLFRK